MGSFPSTNTTVLPLKECAWIIPESLTGAVWSGEQRRDFMISSCEWAKRVTGWFYLSNGRWFLAEKGLLLCCPCAQQDLPVWGWNNSAECGSQPVWCLGLSNSDDQHRWLARTLWLMLLTQTTYTGGLAPPSISCSPGKSHGLPGLLKSSYAEGVITLPMFRDCKHSIKQCLKCRWHIISFP